MIGLGYEPDGTGSARIRGLPLGNLTSQFFANLYLNELDQYVKHKLKVRRYVRYMDDMLFFADDKALLSEWEALARRFVRERLRLELHPGGGFPESGAYKVAQTFLSVKRMPVTPCSAFAHKRRFFLVPKWDTLLGGQGCWSDW